MTRRRWIGGCALTMALAVGEAEAQSVARSFDDLRDDLKSGDIVVVIAQTGETVWGQVDAVTASSLTMFPGERQGEGAVFSKTSRRTFLEAAVAEIHRSDAQARKGDRVFSRPSGSFADLSRVLKPGDTISVTGADGRRTKGVVTALSSSDLTIRPNIPFSLGTSRAVNPPIPVPETFRAGDIAEVTRGGDSRLTGLVIGAGVGLGLGAASVSSAAQQNASDAVVLVPIFGAAGAGIGFLIDGMIGRRVTLFSAETPGARPRAELTPVLRRGAKGVALSVRF